MSMPRKSAAAKKTPAPRQPQDRKPSLRDQLAKKRSRVVTEYFPIDEDGERAVEELEKIDGQINVAEIVAARQGEKATDYVEHLKRRRDEAQARRDEHCLVLQFRGLSEDERDALASEYFTEDVEDDAPQEEKDRIGRENMQKLKGWTYAAMEAAVVDSDLTADEWRDELTSQRWSAGDVQKVRYAIQRAYGAAPADAIPKG